MEKRWNFRVYSQNSTDLQKICKVYDLTKFVKTQLASMISEAIVMETHFDMSYNCELITVCFGGICFESD